MEVLQLEAEKIVLTNPILSVISLTLMTHFKAQSSPF